MKRILLNLVLFQALSILSYGCDEIEKLKGEEEKEKEEASFSYETTELLAAMSEFYFDGEEPEYRRFTINLHTPEEPPSLSTFLLPEDYTMTVNGMHQREVSVSDIYEYRFEDESPEEIEIIVTDDAGEPRSTKFTTIDPSLIKDVEINGSSNSTQTVSSSDETDRFGVSLQIKTGKPGQSVYHYATSSSGTYFHEFVVSPEDIETIETDAEAVVEITARYSSPHFSETDFMQGVFQQVSYLNDNVVVGP